MCGMLIQSLEYGHAPTWSIDPFHIKSSSDQKKQPNKAPTMKRSLLEDSKENA